MKITLIRKVFFTGMLLLFPVFVSHAVFENTGQIIFSFALIVNWLIAILSTIALLVFVWGIVKYIAAAGDEKAAKEGKSIMIYGVIALFVLFSVWGLVNFIGQELGIPANDQFNEYVKPPQVNLQ